MHSSSFNIESGNIKKKSAVIVSILINGHPHKNFQLYAISISEKLNSTNFHIAAYLYFLCVMHFKNQTFRYLKPLIEIPNF